MKYLPSLLTAVILFGACQAQDAGSTLRGAPNPEPWNWTAAQVRSAVAQVRAGRALPPDTWPNGARV
ncbi:MAG: polysaccharide deacetylase, partial [Gemmatimonadetes bacterium]|nr:polysaccharide deacetylase [Gemmatimonadota bacterium]